MQRRYCQSILKLFRYLRSGIRGGIHFRKMVIPLMTIAPTITLMHGLKEIQISRFLSILLNHLISTPLRLYGRSQSNDYVVKHGRQSLNLRQIYSKFGMESCLHRIEDVIRRCPGAARGCRNLRESIFALICGKNGNNNEIMHFLRLWSVPCAVNSCTLCVGTSLRPPPLRLL
jgi:hypothetical protein